MDERDATTKVLPFARQSSALPKRPPRFNGFPKFAKEFGRGTTAAPLDLAPVARLMQDTKRLPD